MSKGRSLENRVAIYLDVKFWILLRDHAAGRSANAATQELLERLRKLVQDGRAFCPISDSVVLEFLKNGDPAPRMEVARIHGIVA